MPPTKAKQCRSFFHPSLASWGQAERRYLIVMVLNLKCSLASNLDWVQKIKIIKNKRTLRMRFTSTPCNSCPQLFKKKADVPMQKIKIKILFPCRRQSAILWLFLSEALLPLGATFLRSNFEDGWKGQGPRERTICFGLCPDQAWAEIRVGEDSLQSGNWNSRPLQGLQSRVKPSYRMTHHSADLGYAWRFHPAREGINDCFYLMIASEH